MKKDWLSEYVDLKVLVNLEDRVDRYNQATHELERVGITDIHHFPAIKHNIGAAGCARSHYEIIKIAKESGYKNVLIFEDDVYFTDDKEIIQSNIIKCFEQIEVNNIQPDFLYLGGYLTAPPGGTMLNSKPDNIDHTIYKINGNRYVKNDMKYHQYIDDNLYELGGCKTTHAYIIFDSVYDKIINAFENINWDHPNTWHGDNRMSIDFWYLSRIHHATFDDTGEIGPREFTPYGIYPCAAGQRESYSNIQNEQTFNDLPKRWDSMLLPHNTKFTTVLKLHVGNNGLGNLLFTLATGYATSKTYGKEMYSTKPNGYDEYKNNILRNIKLTNKTPDNPYVEKSFNYDKIPNVNAIDGYFQSEKYFIDYREEILNLFSMPDNIKKYIDSKYKKILDGNTCSIHVRRGDYVEKQARHPLTNLSYFTNATAEIIKKYNDIKFIIFSDDIEWCKEAFDNDDFTFIEGERDYIDLYMMSLCKHNIISNSTFSWWGAWLNRNSDKTVIVPKIWFGSRAHEDTKDLIPNNWRIL